MSVLYVVLNFLLVSPTQGNWNYRGLICVAIVGDNIIYLLVRFPYSIYIFALSYIVPGPGIQSTNSKFATVSFSCRAIQLPALLK